MISVRLKGETSPREIAVTYTNNDYGKGLADPFSNCRQGL